MLHVFTPFLPKRWLRPLVAPPQRCTLCLAWALAPLCPACTHAFAHGAAPVSLSSLPAFARGALPMAAQALAARPYAYPWDGLVQRLKFGEELPIAAVLADALAQAVAELQAGDAPDVVLALPLHRARLAQRGYNPAWLIAKPLAQRLGLSAEAEALLRLHAAPPQHGAPREQRLAQMRGAFIVNPRHFEALRGVHVAVVDDVLTTGATMHAAVQALAAAGVAKVSLWAVTVAEAAHAA